MSMSRPAIHPPKVPVHVVEETRGSVAGTGPAAFRKRRTVLAPAVSGLEVELEDLQEQRWRFGEVI